MKLPTALSMVTAALLTACAAAPPTSYYTLLAKADNAAPPAQDPLLQVALDPVTVPAQVDSPQMVVRLGDGVIAPVETRRWIAPLAAEIRTALGVTLSQTLAAPNVSNVTPDPRLPLYRVRVAIQRFDSTLGSSARIDAAWTIRSGDHSATCTSSVTTPVSQGYEALALGHQRALRQIATEIGNGITALKAGRETSVCAEAAS